MPFRENDYNLLKLVNSFFLITTDQCRASVESVTKQMRSEALLPSGKYMHECILHSSASPVNTLQVLI